IPGDEALEGDVAVLVLEGLGFDLGVAEDRGGEQDRKDEETHGMLLSGSAERINRITSLLRDGKPELREPRPGAGLHHPIDRVVFESLVGDEEDDLVLLFRALVFGEALGADAAERLLELRVEAVLVEADQLPFLQL